MRAERGCRQSRVCSLVLLGHIRKEMAMLLLERGHHRHRRLAKARPPGTLRAKAACAPQDARTDSALRHLGGRCAACHAHTSPQGLIDLEYFLTDAFRLGQATGLPRL